MTLSISCTYVEQYYWYIYDYVEHAKLWHGKCKWGRYRMLLHLHVTVEYTRFDCCRLLSFVDCSSTFVYLILFSVVD